MSGPPEMTPTCNGKTFSTLDSYVIPRNYKLILGNTGNVLTHFAFGILDFRMVINYVDGMVWSCMWVHLIRDIMDCKSIQKNLIHCIVILSYDLANCVYKLIRIGETRDQYSFRPQALQSVSNPAEARVCSQENEWKPCWEMV